MLNTKTLLAATVGLAFTSAVGAVPMAFYTFSEFGSMGNANNDWGPANLTNNSVIFEATIDFTQAADDAADPITIFELGADAIGSGVAINGDEILFAAGGGSVENTGFVTGLHGLTAGDLGVQILAVLEYNAGTADNELLSLYVNGSLIGTADVVAGGDWAGANTSNLGTPDSFQIFEYVLSINPDAGSGANGQFAGPYPSEGATIAFAAYEFGVGDNTVANILVSSPMTPGDTDGDGDIDDSDLGTSFANYTGPVGAAGGKTAAEGDTDGDGDVDDSDLGTSFSGYTGPQGPAAVPEPTSLALLGLGGLCALRRRRA